MLNRKSNAIHKCSSFDAKGVSGFFQMAQPVVRREPGLGLNLAQELGAAKL